MMEPADSSHPEVRGAEAFATTHWTQVLAARGDSVDAREARKDLCEGYYAPVVAFLRACTRDEDQARELTHEFFARLLTGDPISGVDPERGRFRSYLLGAVKHFLFDYRRREQAARRGGGVEHVPIDPGTDTSPGVDPACLETALTDLEFDREWAVTLLGRALETLETEYKSSGRQALFEMLKPWLTGDSSGLSQAEIGTRLGLSEGAVKVAVHRLRRRFREVIKTEVGQTVEGRQAVEEEMRYLLEVLSG